MEVKGTATALGLNRAAAGVENSNSEEKDRQQARKVNTAAVGENPELEEESVQVSISKAGLNRSRSLDKQEDGSEEPFSEKLALEEMSKKMEGLSSQVINGLFSTSDRLNFHDELKRLTTELNRLNHDAATVTQNDCNQLSQKINELTRIINDAAVYRKNASAIFMVNKTTSTETARTQLDIAI
jgi:hypothetical protein